MKYYTASAHGGRIYTIIQHTYTSKGLFSSISMRFGTTGTTEERAKRNRVYATLHNVHFVKYDVTVSFMAQVLDTVAYFVSHVLVVDTVTYFDIFR